MELTVNGETRQLESSMTVAMFLESHGLNPKMVVVEHNRVILSRDRYEEVTLQAGDELEIVQMMAGG